MDIAQQINIKQFAERFLTIKSLTSGGAELVANCPFHDDKHASFSMNLATGLWKCHTTSCVAYAGGNFVQFIALRKDFTNLKEAEKWICTEAGIDFKPKESKELSESSVNEYHYKLLSSPDILAFLQKNYLYTVQTINRFKLGLHNGRLTIPIFGPKGLINIRKKPLQSGACTGITYHNQMQIYPIQNIQYEEIYIFEGEKDCILACQLSLNAITITGGAGSFNQEWVPLFKDKKIRICYDVDEAGIKGAEKVKDLLLNVAKELKVINIPLAEPKNADFTDYMLTVGLEDFKILVDKTEAEEKAVKRLINIPDFVNKVQLSAASNSEYYFKRVRLNVIVSGKDTQPYLPPRIIAVKCPMGLKCCSRCGMAQYGGEYEIILDHLSSDILRWIDCSIDHHQTLIKDYLEIPPICKIWKHRIIRAQNVEEITLIPEIDYSTQDTEYVVRTVYTIGLRVKSNHNYQLEAVTLPHPKNQYATQLVYAIKENKTAIDQFRMNDQIRQQLGVFQIEQTRSNPIPA